MKKYSVSLLILTTAFLYGCSSYDGLYRNIDLKYFSPDANRNKPVRAESTLKTELASQVSRPQEKQLEYLQEDTKCVWVVDARPREEVYGFLISRSAIQEWVANGIAEKLGIEAAITFTAPEDDSYLKILKAYIRPIATSISAMVVIEVSNEASSEIVREQFTRTNWNGSDEEFSRLLSQALNGALYKIIPDIPYSKTCRSRGREAEKIM